MSQKLTYRTFGCFFHTLEKVSFLSFATILTVRVVSFLAMSAGFLSAVFSISFLLQGLCLEVHSCL